MKLPHIETMKSAKPKRNQEFKALELKLTEESVAPHIVYLKEHSVREHTADKPSGRTLLVLNIPPYVDEQSIKNAFRAAGKIQSVKFYLKPTTAEEKHARTFIPEAPLSTFKAAYLVFEKVAHLDKALTLTELQPLNSTEHEIKVGMKKWIDEYNASVMPAKMLKEKVETFMKKYDQDMKKAEKKEKALEEEDDEGWITVTKRGKVQSIARTEKVENKIMTKEAKANKRKELKNFYTFQIRESKMKHIVSLRQKFEEDKKKIQQIKQSRRFKPF